MSGGDAGVLHALGLLTASQPCYIKDQTMIIMLYVRDE
jgi:hypothetical protein